MLSKCELSGNWNGGNDSGGCTIELEEHPEIDEKVRQAVQNYLEYECEQLLAYGSWAGDFSSDGTIRYDEHQSKVILSGNEYDEENQETIATHELRILDFIEEPYAGLIDSVNVYARITDDYDPDDTIRVRVNIKNGPWFTQFISLENSLKDQLITLLNDYEYSDGCRLYVDTNFMVTEPIKLEIGQVADKEIYHEIEISNKTMNLKTTSYW